MWVAPVRGRGENQPTPEREGAGSLLLAAAAAETGLVAALAPALPTELSHTTPVSRCQVLSTLLFLGVVGLRRRWDLRGYAGDALALERTCHPLHGGGQQLPVHQQRRDVLEDDPRLGKVGYVADGRLNCAKSLIGHSR